MRPFWNSRNDSIYIPSLFLKVGILKIDKSKSSTRIGQTSRPSSYSTDSNICYNSLIPSEKRKCKIFGNIYEPRENSIFYSQLCSLFYLVKYIHNLEPLNNFLRHAGSIIYCLFWKVGEKTRENKVSPSHLEAIQ